MGTASGAQNRYSGVVQPQKTVEINADSERTVKEILVEVGDEVSEGTPLFSYDTEDLKMELEQAKLELENQDIEISNYKNQIQELEKERNAPQDLPQAADPLRDFVQLYFHPKTSCFIPTGAEKAARPRPSGLSRPLITVACLTREEIF